MTTRIDYPADNAFLNSYCSRLSLTNPDPTLAFISQAYDRQVKTIAFENIDVQNGKIVSIDPADFVKKILTRQRGGYCYELNGLFALLLQALDISYTLVACRPLIYPPRRAKTHMAIIANIEGEDYLVDTGFGAYGPRAPIALGKLDTPIAQGPEQFKLSCQPLNATNDEYTLSALVDGQWQAQYAFSTYPNELIDFTPANYLNSTYPDVLFTQKLVVLIFTDTGRKVLAGDGFRVIENGERTERRLDEREIGEVLKQEFLLTSGAT